MSELKKGAVDWTAIALLALGIGSFQVFLEEGYSEDWFQSPFIVVMACLSVVGIILFVIRVARALFDDRGTLLEPPVFDDEPSARQILPGSHPRRVAASRGRFNRPLRSTRGVPEARGRSWWE